jgi:hypothetical protein
MPQPTVLTAGRTNSPICSCPRAAPHFVHPLETKGEHKTMALAAAVLRRFPSAPPQAPLPPASSHLNPYLHHPPASADLSRPQPRLRSPFPPPYLHSTPRPCELKPQPTPHALTLWSRRRTWSGGSTSCYARCRRRGGARPASGHRGGYRTCERPIRSIVQTAQLLRRAGGMGGIDLLCHVGCAVQARRQGGDAVGPRSA